MTAGDYATLWALFACIMGLLLLALLVFAMYRVAASADRHIKGE